MFPTSCVPACCGSYSAICKYVPRAFRPKSNSISALSPGFIFCSKIRREILVAIKMSKAVSEAMMKNSPAAVEAEIATAKRKLQSSKRLMAHWEKVSRRKVFFLTIV